MSTAVANNPQPLYLRRRIVNIVALLLSCLTALFGLFFLGWILFTLASKGLAGINLDLFTKMTPPPMQEGGLANAFFGSAVMCGLAIAIGTPLGVLAGTWLAEYGNFRKAGTVVRFVNDILLSAPSIVLGLFVYTLYVMQTGGQFSAFAGALSLAFIVLPYTRSAVIGGIFLGLGRALGETMAVAFVIGNSVRLSPSLLEPGTTIAALIANDFGEATETYRSALLLLGFVLFIVTFVVLAIARLMLMRLSRKEGN